MSYTDNCYAKVARMVRRFWCIQAAKGVLWDLEDVMGRIIRSNWRAAILMDLADRNPTDDEIEAAVLHATRPYLGERIRNWFADAFSDALERR